MLPVFQPSPKSGTHAVNLVGVNGYDFHEGGCEAFYYLNKEGEKVYRYPNGRLDFLYRDEDGRSYSRRVRIPDFELAAQAMQDKDFSNQYAKENFRFNDEVMGILGHSFGITREQFASYFGQYEAGSLFEVQPLTQAYQDLIDQLSAETPGNTSYVVLHSDGQQGSKPYDGPSLRLSSGKVTHTDGVNYYTLSTYKDKTYANYAYVENPEEPVINENSWTNDRGRTYYELETPIDGFVRKDKVFSRGLAPFTDVPQKDVTVPVTRYNKETEEYHTREMHAIVRQFDNARVVYVMEDFREPRG